MQDDVIEVLRVAPMLRYLDYSGYTCDMPAEVCEGIASGLRRVQELYLQTTNQVTVTSPLAYPCPCSSSRPNRCVRTELGYLQNVTS